MQTNSHERKLRRAESADADKRTTTGLSTRSKPYSSFMLRVLIGTL